MVMDFIHLADEAKEEEEKANEANCQHEYYGEVKEDVGLLHVFAFEDVFGAFEVNAAASGASVV